MRALTRVERPHFAAIMPKETGGYVFADFCYNLG